MYLSLNYTNLIIIENFIKIFPKYIKSIYYFNKKDILLSLKSEINLNKNFKFFFNCLKNLNYFFFKQLIDITIIDFLKKKCRFSIYYTLLSLYNNKNLIFKIDIKSKKNNLIYTVNSLNDIFKSSIWLEREVWDMYGIFFFENIDLRRILTDYGFKSFPLRKDFPLVGYLELTFNILTKSLKYINIELNQNFRKFNFINSWESL
jgi:NADH-quinone oxidoreductase subunit C